MEKSILKEENRMLVKNGIYLKKTIRNTVVGDSDYYFNMNNIIEIKETVSKAFKNLEAVFYNKERIAFIESNKRLVRCSTEAIKHGIIKTKNRKNYRVNSFIVTNIGFLLKNARKINETKPAVKYPKGQDIYLSVISDTQGNSYPCRIIVNKENSALNEIEYIDQLKAVKGIKKERVPNGIPTLEVGDVLSIYTLEQLAKEVKNKYSDCLPNLLLRKFRIKREKTRLSENILF